VKTAPAKIPPLLLLQALGLSLIVGIPVLFVAFNQIRRACGNQLFGSREHFCSAHELGRWLLSFPGWTYCILAVSAFVVFLLTRLFLRRIAS
jgi:hypothetical protein